MKFAVSALVLLAGCGTVSHPGHPRTLAPPVSVVHDDAVREGVCEVVHDGDTALVRLFLDDETQRLVWVRLRNVFAPELSEPGGKEARLKLMQVIPVGSHVTVKRFPVKSEKPWPVYLRSFNRYVGEVTNSNGVNVNEAVK